MMLFAMFVRMLFFGEMWMIIFTMFIYIGAKNDTEVFIRAISAVMFGLMWWRLNTLIEQKEGNQ